MPVLSRVGLLSAFIAATFSSLPAYAVPETGLYFQYLPEGVGNIQAVAHDGAVQVDYIPALSPFGGNPMQVLQAAARFPAPILDTALQLRGLIGYRQQWAFYSGQEDTYGGIDAGLSASFHLGALPFIGPYVAPVRVHAYGFENWLVIAKARGVGFSTNNTLLPSFGGGLSYELPTSARLCLTTWSGPTLITKFGPTPARVSA